MMYARQPDVVRKGEDWQKGTSLSELLISMTLFLFLILIVSRFMISMHKNGTRLQSTLNNSRALFAAVDLLKRDIQLADHTIASWILLSNKPIWSVNGIHIQWYIKAGKLIRRTGICSKELQMWKEHTDSLIAYGIETFVVEPNQNEKKNITTVSYKISIKPYELEGVVPIKNRDITWNK